MLKIGDKIEIIDNHDGDYCVSDIGSKGKIIKIYTSLNSILVNFYYATGISGERVYVIDTKCVKKINDYDKHIKIINKAVKNAKKSV